MRSSTSSQPQSPSSPMSSAFSAEPSPITSISRRSTGGSSTGSPSSPTEASFFSAIASKVRSGRSRSRSRVRVTRDRSHSPMEAPPSQLYTAQPTSSRPDSSSRPTVHARHSSSASTSSNHGRPQRPPPGPTRRSTASSDPWRGRHSNDWLFGGFSFTETVKDICHSGKSSK